MNCVRLRLSVETTTIFVRDGWLVVEVANSAELEEQLRTGTGGRMLTVAEVSARTGFSRGAVRDWIKCSKLSAVRIGREFRVREQDLERLVGDRHLTTRTESNAIGRRRKAISV